MPNYQYSVLILGWHVVDVLFILDIMHVLICILYEIISYNPLVLSIHIE